MAKSDNEISREKEKEWNNKHDISHVLRVSNIE